jgi:DNA-directed RNA polymerase subunit RPC12/RpoP
MALRVYKCSSCGDEVRTLKSAPEHCGKKMETTLTAPQVKFVEPRDPERKGRSVLKDQNRMLKERAKTHVRENELNDFVQEHGVQAAKQFGWVTEKGTVRKKIDEL